MSCWISRSSRAFWALGVLTVFFSLAASRPARASLVETFVMSMAGQASVGPNFQCTTGAAPAPVRSFFGPVGPFVPNDGLSTCGIDGGFTLQSAASGSLSDTTSLNTTFNSGANTYNGTASANATFGKLGAEAHDTSTGPSNSLLYKGSEAYGLTRETGMQPTGAGIVTGSNGMVRFLYTVDGSLSVSQPPPFVSTADVEVMYQFNSGPIFTLMRAQINNSTTLPFITSPSPTGLSGFTLAVGSIVGSGQFQTFDLPVVFGTPFDFTMGLLAYSIAGPSGVNHVDFSTSATLSGIQLFQNGQMLTDFVITSDSGTLYGPNGVIVPQNEAPEPFGVGLLGFALFFGTVARSRRTGRRRTTP